MRIDIGNENHIIAENGKVFKRISDGIIFGEEIHLGYAYYIGGVLLPEPLLELPEHFEEVEVGESITLGLTNIDGWLHSD